LGIKALLWAAEFGEVDIVNELIQEGADVHGTNDVRSLFLLR